MRFIESTSFFVRAVTFDFKNRNPSFKLKFRLVPMVHVGTEEYYQESYKSLNECNEIFYEGAVLPGIKLFSNEYQRIARKVGLVTQSEAFDYQGIKHKLIHADYNKESGKSAWNKLSIKEKFKYSILKPLKFRIQYRNATRKLLAKSFMTSNEEAWLAYGPLPDKEGSAENLIVRSRDNIVIKLMEEKIMTENKSDKLIGIMYGANHMKYMSNFLTSKNKFIPQNGKFIKVFNL